MQETGNLGEWWIHVQTPTLKICSPMKVFKGGILWGGSQSLLSLLSATVFRLSSDWLLMTQQGGAPGILGSARGYHLLPGVGAPHFLLKNSKVFCYVCSFRRNQDPASWLHYCFLASPSLFLPSFPCLMSSCLNLPFGTLAMSRRLKLFSCKQEVGNTERIFTWEGPMGS